MYRLYILLELVCKFVWIQHKFEPSLLHHIEFLFQP